MGFDDKSASSSFGDKGQSGIPEVVRALDPAIGARHLIDCRSTTDIGAYGVGATGTNQTGGLATAAAGTVGVLLQTVSALNDRASWVLEASNFRDFLVGGGKIVMRGRFQIPTLSDGVNRIMYQVGLGDIVAAGSDHVDACCFEYDLAGNASSNLFFVTSANSVRTRTDLGVAPTAGAWVRVRAEIALDGSSIRVFASITDGTPVLVATITTNIPTAASRHLTPLIRSVKTLGAGALTALTDYLDVYQIFTSGRG
jgi:hypothetical protein